MNEPIFSVLTGKGAGYVIFDTNSSYNQSAGHPNVNGAYCQFSPTGDPFNCSNQEDYTIYVYKHETENFYLFYDHLDFGDCGWIVSNTTPNNLSRTGPGSIYIVAQPGIHYFTIQGYDPTSALWTGGYVNGELTFDGSDFDISSISCSI